MFSAKNETLVFAFVVLGSILFGFILGAVVFGRTVAPDSTIADNGIRSSTSNVESASTGVADAQGAIASGIVEVDGSIDDVDRIAGSVDGSTEGLSRALALAKQLESGLRELSNKD